MDTIFALASAPGKAGVSVIRVSGPGALACVSSLTGRVVQDRGMRLMPLSASDGSHLDTALVLTFLAPASFTGEDVAELHLHGSPAIVSAVLAHLGAQDGARMAAPGEFTRRALENGKMDLTQVEGLADLIDAETEAQRRQAQRVLSGDLARMTERWRADLIHAAALLEATIDFADEEVPVDVTADVRARLDAVRADLARECSGVAMAERIRSGFEVAIVGAPNVGKSTLLNRLAGRAAAITSARAGTTRDIIEVAMDLGGLAVTMLDTAGMRQTDDDVERIGVDLAVERANAADLRVVLSDGAWPAQVNMRPGDIMVRPKVDIHGGSGVSGLTGEGVDRLVTNIRAELSGRAQTAGIATRARHGAAMSDALQRLDSGRDLLEHGPDRYDIAAEEIRSAIRALDAMIGRVDVEDLLDEIFARFCLGK